jgi:hypothetical protein
MSWATIPSPNADVLSGVVAQSAIGDGKCLPKDGIDELMRGVACRGPLPGQRWTSSITDL